MRNRSDSEARSADSPASLDGALPGLRVALEVQIPSDVRYIERVVGMVARQCEELNFPPRQVALNVPVALSEALSNAILYGSVGNPAGQIRVRVSVDDARLVLEVVDQGRGFDLAQCVADPTTPENLEREQGRGLFLMLKLMDRVERFDDQGNVVRLTLNRG